MSYEYGNRLGQRLVQVSLLGVRLKYQRFGVGAKLVRALVTAAGFEPGPPLLFSLRRRARQLRGLQSDAPQLEGEATPERPEAAIAWADHRAVPFFRRFGFNDDKILCSRSVGQ